MRALRLSRHERVLFGVLFASFAYFQQGGFDNANSRFDASMALTFEHHLAIDDFAANTIDKVRVGDHFFSEKAPGSAYLALPVTVLARAFGATTANGDFLLYLASLATVALFTALSAIFFRRLLLALSSEMSESRATQATLLVYLGTLLFPYATILFGHALAAAFLVIAFERLWPLLADAPFTRARVAVGMVACGVTVFCEYPAFVAVAPLVVTAFWRQKKIVAKSLVWVAPLVLLLMAHQWLSFGNPFSPGYGKLSGTIFASQMSTGFFGVRAPDPAAAVQLLIGVYRGLFVYCPILLFAAAGFFFVRAQRRVFFVALLSATLVWLLNASYAFWQGGVCFGPRHLVPAIPLLALGLAAMPQRWWRQPLFGFVAAISVALNVLGTATTLFVNEHDPAPLSHAYWDFLRHDDVSVNPMQWSTPVAERTAHWLHFADYPWASWNWGERFGLHGFFSLLPLFALWILFWWWSARASSSPSDENRRRRQRQQ